VSVVVPFAGDAPAAGRLLAALAELSTVPGDEVIVADNSFQPAIAEREGGGVRVVRATGERSSYHARNVGAGAASGEWLLFTDADCRPVPDLLDRYFALAPGGRCGALAGEVVGDPTQDSLVARWARARGRLEQRRSLQHPFRPYGSTANLLVRRVAFDELGGFAEGIRSGGDTDLCWRLHGAGWTVEYRERAFVWHRHRETVLGVLRQAYRYGGSQAWLERRYPGCHSAGGRLLRMVARTLFRAGALLLRGRFEEAGFSALDLGSFLAEGVGHRASNRPSPARGRGGAKIDEPAS
jgi:GT2 family glycosyltransferase